MGEDKNGRECSLFGDSGLVLRCHRCGRELPLLHPHIVVERYDDDENMICEWCYAEYCSKE